MAPKTLVPRTCDVHTSIAKGKAANCCLGTAPSTYLNHTGKPEVIPMVLKI